MAKQQSFRHHYVPQWYQKGFLNEGQTSFKILDLHPFIYRDKTGKVRGRGRSILDKGADAWFFESDLYTTQVFGEPNDDIERLLFGPLDEQGKIAIQAYLHEDWQTVSKTYGAVFEFMDALRLRTPKGMLLWGRSGIHDHSLLLHQMQLWRRMHCLMWAEGVLEIVNAPLGGPKFIFSDHPVTFFNRFVFPHDKHLRPGLDPPQAWMGTQTIFPMDRNHLFVLTHLEWSQKQGERRARIPRTNPRLFDDTVIRFDNCIRTRELTVSQVLEVNYLIKVRAHRYIAGQSEEDLFPERSMKMTLWSKLGHFLMPSKDKLHKFGGKTFVGYENGEIHFHDEFGRKPVTRAEYEKRKLEVEELRLTLNRILAREASRRA
ncbi:DUF4238 domain-containing protein [Pseudomonas sp. NPDC087803]|uniref:DUF4238 domain-containing protein n=1 Tax=Pseudomonas sp. NPDC087803 TaxID=3364448 RepID=UPI003801E945